MLVSVTIQLDCRRMKVKTGKYPVKLLVIHNRQSQRYQTIFDLTEREFEILSASRASEKTLEVKNALKQLKQEAEEFIDSLESFTFGDFEKGFVLNNPLIKQRKLFKRTTEVSDRNPSNFDFAPYHKKFPIIADGPYPVGTVAYTYLSYIKKLIAEERLGTAVSYHCSYRSLTAFAGNICFTDIDVSFLRQYEKWTAKADMSKSTVGIYLRSLRAIFNEAIADNIIRKEKHYPFGRRKYLIPSSKNIKKALSLDQIKDIYYYNPSCESERKARDYWLFCYFANGINPKDIALLKYKNIDGEYIYFERAKTEHTSRTDPRTISIYLSEEIRGIISRLGNADKSPNNYIFPILHNGITPLKQYDLIQFFVRFINDWMGKICENLGISKKATTIVGRHSFSTVLKNSGASTEFIQEALGHTDKRTTENYLGSFQNDIKKSFALKLSLFKSESDLS